MLFYFLQFRQFLLVSIAITLLYAYKYHIYCILFSLWFPCISESLFTNFLARVLFIYIYLYSFEYFIIYVAFVTFILVVPHP